MSLISSRTNLKSLRFGNDRPGGGSSSQPFIQKSIPLTDNFSGLKDDFILRGGINSITRSADDVIRLGKYFTDLKSPKGILFIAKQNLLSRVAVRTQSSGILNENIYTPLNTLGQVAGNAFGIHLNKQGLNPFAGMGKPYTPDNYIDRILSEKTSGLFNNRLQELYDVKIVKSGNPSIFRDNNISPNENLIISYTGGPNSVIGIGRTNIKFADQRTNKVDIEAQKLNPQNTYWDQKQLNEIPKSPNPYIPNQIIDFRSKLRGNKDIYSTKNIESRVNLGNPGTKGNRSNYTEGKGDGGLDKITMYPLYQSNIVTSNETKNDLVKFRIASIDLNDLGSTKTFMHFRAFLNSISDSYNSDWESQKYIGRGENFYNQTGFDRRVSLSWTVAAQSKEELIPMYKKLNYLASTLAPDYSPQGYMRGNLISLTIGGYFYEQPGFITGLQYELAEDSTWEIGINTDGENDSTVKELPHIIKVTSF
ncbi:MAG: hypothetical protein AABY22_26105, partial [Nanoarchaeota archaeon]